MRERGGLQHPGREREVRLEGSGFRVQGSGLAVAAWVAIACLLAGCGGAVGPGGDSQGVPGGSPRSTPATQRQSSATRQSTVTQRQSPATSHARNEEDGEEGSDDWPEPERVRSLADLLNVADTDSGEVAGVAPLEVDKARAAAAGIRKVEGERLTLFTDLPPDEEVDLLPEVFRQAFPQWCDRFGIDPADHPDWRMTGFLMKDPEAFRQAELLPEELPPFEHGFSQNHDLWLYEQPSPYYRRHLLLHEGTHGFMNTILGGSGPSWYMEGMAELLGTHRWHERRLTMGHMPASRDEAPMWGRIKIIQDDFAAHRAKTFQGVLEYGPRAHLRTEPYAWCWAAAVLLDRHPRYQERFRQLPRFLAEPGFSGRFREMIGDDWDDLAEEWQVFVADLEYGHDIPRTAVDFTPGRPPVEAGESVEVSADRGWQNSGLALEAGIAYRVRASGRYQVADQPQIWWCEPGGVSIRYYKGLPLGMLLAAVRAEPAGPEEPSGLIRPVAVGLGTTLTPERSGTLFLRVNDSSAELGDNAGTLSVHLRAATQRTNVQ